MSPRKLQPALLGGVFIGVFSALPVVSLGNACCCLWLIAGGVLASWLMQQNHPFPVTPGDGAAAGFLAGIFGAFVYLLIAWPIAVLVGPMLDAWLERALEGAGDLPLRDIVERYRGTGARGLTILLGFLLQLVLGMTFATLGGLLGAMLFKKPPLLPPPPPPGTPEVPWTPSSSVPGPPPLPGAESSKGSE